MERTADTLLANLKRLRGEGKTIPKDVWLEAAFDLNLFRIDEAHTFHQLSQEVAKKKFAILKSQEKKNVSLADAEVHALDEWVAMQDQAAKLYAIEEFVRIAKKQADLDY